MSLAFDITTLRPQLRPEIILGPPVLSRGAQVHYVKDAVANCFYRIGTREHFLVSRMDGKRSLQEIGAEYENYAGKCLSPTAWTELLKLLAQRQFLVGSTTPDGLRALEKKARKTARKERGILRARIALVNPDTFLGRILPLLRFAFHPVFVSLALAAIVVLEIFFFSHLGQFDSEVTTTFRAGVLTHSWFLCAFIALTMVILVTHEFAHGLTCKHFGGSVQEIGLAWRYFFPFPYCKLDDVVLFQNRWQRVYAAFAGVFINLLTLLPFAWLWYVEPETTSLHILSAWVLFMGNLFSLFNLLPFIELDGYLILTYALNMVDLQKDAYRLCLSKVQHLFRKEAPLLRYEQRASTYLIYGIVSLLFTLAFVILLFVYWFVLLKLWVGPVTAWLIYLSLALLLLLLSRLGRLLMRKKRRVDLLPHAQ